MLHFPADHRWYPGLYLICCDIHGRILPSLDSQAASQPGKPGHPWWPTHHDKPVPEFGVSWRMFWQWTVPEWNLHLWHRYIIPGILLWGIELRICFGFMCWQVKLGGFWCLNSAADYIGPDCSVRSDASPTINRIESSGTCDLQQRPCRQIFIAVEDIVDTPDLTCKVIPFKVRQNPVTWVATK